MHLIFDWKKHSTDMYYLHRGGYVLTSVCCWVSLLTAQLPRTYAPTAVSFLNVPILGQETVPSSFCGCYGRPM